MFRGFAARARLLSLHIRGSARPVVLPDFSIFLQRFRIFAVILLADRFAMVALWRFAIPMVNRRLHVVTAFLTHIDFPSAPANTGGPHLIELYP